MRKLRRNLSLALFAFLLLIIVVYRDNILIGFGHKWYGWVGSRMPSAGDSVRGVVETKTFHSEKLGIDRSVAIYLPYNYNDFFVGNFPVLYLLHGFAGVKEDWLINAKIEQVVERLIAEGTLPPLILVMPDGNGPIIKDSEYLDASLVNQPMESHIVDELVPYVDSHYRTIPSGSGRALAGISTGAYGAVNILLHHPDTFHSAISLGGYFINREWPTDKLIGSDQSLRKYNNPLQYLDDFATEEKIHLFLSISQNDYKDFITDNEQLAAKLKDKNIDHVFVRTDGVHFWSSWNKAIPEALIWLGQKFREGI